MLKQIQNNNKKLDLNKLEERMEEMTEDAISNALESVKYKHSNSTKRRK